MNQSEKRINAIVVNVAKGAYTLAELKDLLKRGLDHVDCIGEKHIDKQFLVNLCHIDAAIQRIERTKEKNQ